MRVDALFSQAKQTSTQPISFEMFPPKGKLTMDDAREVAASFAELTPDFVSVTYSAAGSGNGRATTDIASMLTHDYGLNSVAHLTCISLTREGLDQKIEEMHAAGIENVLALRGDRPANAPRPTSEPDFRYAKDIITPLVEAGFCVGAAAYPEGHIDCDDLDADIRHLKEKQDAGASFFVTQLFYDNECCYRFLDRAERAGITIPITCGVMPFMSKASISRMVFMCGASLPAPVIKLLARYEDDEEGMQQAGIEYACEQLEDLAAHGVDGLHVYTMNRPRVAQAAMAALRA